MIEPILLSQEEQVRFMRALYAVFNRDGNINSHERAVLNSLGQTFGLNQFEYEHFIELTCQNLANEIVSIRDIRIRSYFLAIIDDVYNNEFKLPFSAKSDGFLNLNLCLKERLMPKLKIL